jgi:hypothetical protein
MGKLPGQEMVNEIDCFVPYSSSWERPLGMKKVLKDELE